MPTHRQLIVEVPTSTQGNGSSDTSIHQACFPASPIFKNELTDQTVKEIFVREVQEGQYNDGGHTFGEINRDYADAPNMGEVETGGGGLPATAYSPNIASPEQGHDPTSIPEAGVEATIEAQGQGSPFPGDQLASPHETSAVISQQTTLGSLGFGTSEPKT